VSLHDLPVVVVGAGMGGLAAAIDLARRGARVTVVDKQPAPGGKMRHVMVDGVGIDGGPTVFTMRWIFDGLLEAAGTSLEAELTIVKAEVLARHAWTSGGRLDLFADIDRSADAIGSFAGAADAAGFRAFCARAREVYDTLRGPFIASQRPSPLGLIQRVGIGNLGAMLRTTPFQTLWAALGTHFQDQRLQQLFGRYSTYVGSSPFRTPATLMLVAHVEQDGVWLVKGGMHAVAVALQRVAERLGATFRFEAPVARIVLRDGRVSGVQLASGERLEAAAVVFNGDVSALGRGLLGEDVVRAAPVTRRKHRSLSAQTWCVRAATSGFPLDHHNVFFSTDNAQEFDAVFSRRSVCAQPTVYLCAQDRGAVPTARAGTPERMLLLINAPADGDVAPMAETEVETLRQRADGVLRACGLFLDWSAGAAVATGPAGFGALFPGTGGALYGRANHGPFATFARSGSASAIPGLYLAGGSVHPGPGVPMAAMSGRLAAARLLEDSAQR
jgi:1-hydroxycarotenoid 3,4-desaturase